MRVAVCGGGPGGLYSAILLRKLGHEVDVWERNAPDDTFGFGVVFSDETMSAFEISDPPSEWARAACHSGDPDGQLPILTAVPLTTSPTSSSRTLEHLLDVGLWDPGAPDDRPPGISANLERPPLADIECRRQDRPSRVDAVVELDLAADLNLAAKH